MTILNKITLYHYQIRYLISAIYSFCFRFIFEAGKKSNSRAKFTSKVSFEGFSVSVDHYVLQRRRFKRCYQICCFRFLILFFDIDFYNQNDIVFPLQNSILHLNRLLLLLLLLIFSLLFIIYLCLGPPIKGITNEMKLNFYGLFKQASAGPCKIPEPSRLQIVKVSVN